MINVNRKNNKIIIKNSKMKKKFFLFATAVVALAGCSSNEYVGDNKDYIETLNGGTPIVFSSIANQKITRADGTATDAQKLGYSFAVYGTKTVSSTTYNVFAQGQYNASSNTPYWVWYNSSTANNTASNTHDWEYVGAAGSKTIPENGTFNLATAQTIKYWDYSASQYDFVAYKATVESPTISNLTNAGFTVNANASELAGLYIADKKVITSKNDAPGFPNTTIADNIGDVVQFTFRAAGAKVRLGIYETIPGYAVSAVTFHYNSATSTDKAGLDGKFIGDASSKKDFAVTYDATSKKAIVTGADNAKTAYFDFGSFTVNTSSTLGTTSVAPTWAGGNSNYINVLPNTSNVGPMTLAVDYTLYNSTTQETINVTGAKAVVPEAFMKWNPNYAYTYLFKISDNTNGKTGGESGPEGLYPITFDAVTIANQDGTQGTTTIVATPSITTYQSGSVISTGIKYVKDKPIYATVEGQDGALQPLTSTTGVGFVQVYSLGETAKTEADLQITSPSTTVTTTIGNANATVDNITFTANKYLSFTPTAVGYYAIKYQTVANPAAYTYKVIHVEE